MGLKSNKAYELREMMRRSVRRNDLISAFFEDYPEVEHIAFAFEQEYDDNNYSDHTRLTSINRAEVVDEWGDEPQELPVSDEVLYAARDLVSCVAEEFGYSHSEDWELYRKNYPPQEGPKGDLTDEESEYLSSYLSHTELPEKWFLKKQPKWANYYALDWGRFTEKTEFALFAKKGRMREAFWYAFHVIKGRLPEPVENFFLLSANKDGEDHEWLRRYMEFRGKPQEVA
jgi:hypothetical protein